jgi:Domain of unknown function (DUF4912)/Rho termination factor, N-terminal domain
MKSAELEGMSVKELRAMAAIKGVARASKLSKTELITALTAGPSPAPAAARGPAKPPGGAQRRRKQATFTSTAKPELAGPSSSALRPAAPAKPLPPHPAIPGSDPGLPVPPRYGHDRLVLMVQDPQHIFAYWEISSENLSQVQTRIGGQAMPVLIVHTASGHEYREVDLRGGNYYLAVAPAGQYEAELALRDAHGKLHPLARSNKVSTPAPSVSSRVDEQWMGVDESFNELLELAGLPGHPRPASSASRLADQRLAAWNWERIAGMGSGSLSSHSLSSRELVAPR